MTTASPPVATGARRAPARWTTPIGAALSAYLARRARFLSATSSRAHDARATQLHQLRALMRLAANTEVGRAANFTRALNRSDADLVRAYRDAIQPGDYEVWRARYRRMRELAQPDVTWPGVVTDWAQTSGTTGGEKYIPVSRHMMRSNYRAALDIFAHAKRFGVSLPQMFGGRLLFLGGSTDVSINDRGIRTGDLSGLVTGLIKWPLSQVYTPGPEVALLSHWPTKIEAMAKVTLPQDIRFISGMASWSLVLCLRASSNSHATAILPSPASAMSGLTSTLRPRWRPLPTPSTPASARHGRAPRTPTSRTASRSTPRPRASSPCRTRQTTPAAAPAHRSSDLLRVHPRRGDQCAEPPRLHVR
ncbi:MAG: GH3 auxin-responsive promoter family protein [Phycisphaerales bacterium]